MRKAKCRYDQRPNKMKKKPLYGVTTYNSSRYV
jgi:hypothetical protein